MQIHHTKNFPIHANEIVKSSIVKEIFNYLNNLYLYKKYKRIIFSEKIMGNRKKSN